MTNTLSKQAEELITAFEEAAQTHGWQQDQGYNPAYVIQARLDFEETGKALRAYIAALEANHNEGL